MELSPVLQIFNAALLSVWYLCLLSEDCLIRPKHVVEIVNGNVTVWQESRVCRNAFPYTLVITAYLYGVLLY
jgi:hypothetical protein